MNALPPPIPYHARTGAALISRLRILRRCWQAGLALEGLLWVIGVLALAALAYGLLDYFLAFSPAVRLLLSGVIATAGITLLGWRAFRLGMLGDRDTAQRADVLAPSGGRRPVLGALDLETSPPAPGASPFQTYLRERAIEAGVSQLRHIDLRDAFPRRNVFRQARVTALQVAALVLVAILLPQAAAVIAQRMAFPWADIPPYSPYKFLIEPENPEVVYAGHLPLAVQIEGAPVREQVWLLTRQRDGVVRQSAAFRESPERYSQRLDNVVEPVAFAFAVGSRARSRWREVDVRFEPKIALTGVHLRPPEYSRLPPKQFFLGKGDLTGLPGTQATLTITSNRPLADGTLEIKSATGLVADSFTIPATRAGPNSVAFDWIIKSDADLSVTIRDVRGTPSSAPLRISQKTIADKPPAVAITDPDLFVLATPDTELPFSGYAEDDYALRRVELVRTVIGYRDRVKPLGPEQSTQRVAFEDKLKIDTLGAIPGQTLELFLEAADHNPTLMGTAASEVLRIQIISHEEYAERLRKATTLEEFAARFRLAREAAEQVKQSLRELSDMAQKGASDEALRKKIEELSKGNAKAAELFEKLAKDFAAFDVEQLLKESSAGMAKTLREGQSRLDQQSQHSPLNPAKIANAAEDFLHRLGESQKGIREASESAEEVEKVARMMQNAGRFHNIVQRQSELKRRLDRFQSESASGSDPELLKALAAEQQSIRQTLGDLQQQMRQDAENLPPGYGKLGESARGFANRIDEFKIGDFMNAAAQAGENSDGPKAGRNASVALEKLQSLIEQEGTGGGFGQMCKTMQFQVTQGQGKSASPSVAQSLQQMMSAIMGQMGGGENGYLAEGSSLDIPVYGPNRSHFTGQDHHSSSRGKKNQTDGKGDGTGDGSSTVQPEATANIADTSKQDIQSEALPLETIPEKYREAVIRYFGGTAASPSQTQPPPPNPP